MRPTQSRFAQLWLLSQELSRGDLGSALGILQRDLASLNISQARLHKLAGCMLCTSQEGLKEQVEWVGTKGFKNRQQLVQNIQVG